MKHLKGTLKIQMLRKTYKFGDTITGSFRLHAKKEIIWEDLNIHLVAYKRETNYGSDGKRHTRRVEFARYSENIESGITYDMGLKREYDIKVVIPSYDDVFGEKNEINFGDSTLGKLTRFAINSTKRTQLTWQVQVDLDAVGIDLHTKKEIFITK